MFDDEMRGEENVQLLSEKFPCYALRWEGKVLIKLVNVNSRLAVHSTATASVCRGI